MIRAKILINILHGTHNFKISQLKEDVLISKFQQANLKHFLGQFVFGKLKFCKV